MKCSVRLVLCELLIFTVILDIVEGKVGRDELRTPQIFKIILQYVPAAWNV